MFSLFGLSRTMHGLLNRRDSKIASLVSLAAVAVRAMNEHSCSRDLNSWRLANHSESCIPLGFGLSPREKFQQVNFFYRSLSHSISQIKQWLLEKWCDNIDTGLYGSFHRKISLCTKLKCHCDEIFRIRCFCIFWIFKWYLLTCPSRFVQQVREDGFFYGFSRNFFGRHY